MQWLSGRVLDLRLSGRWFKPPETLCCVLEHDTLSSSNTPTKQSKTQHLVEYYKQFLQEENKKSGNVMQQTMHNPPFVV